MPNRVTKALVQAHLTLLCFTDTAYFYRSKVCGNPASSMSMGTVFPIAFARFLSLCHILVILAIFQTFSLLLYLLQCLWSVIFDVITMTH